MPKNPKNSDKPLLKVGEAAAILGVHPDTLRGWEEDGKLIPIRTPGGHRRYLENDILELTKKADELQEGMVEVYLAISKEAAEKLELFAKFAGKEPGEVVEEVLNKHFDEVVHIPKMSSFYENPPVRNPSVRYAHSMQDLARGKVSPKPLPSKEVVREILKKWVEEKIDFTEEAMELAKEMQLLDDAGFLSLEVEEEDAE